MISARTLVVTVPDMISEEDLAPLRERSEVEYREFGKVAEADLASLCAGFDYLMLNYDVIKHLTPGFYADSHVQSLRAISADITGMDWASPESARDSQVRLLNIPHYSTESVAETIVAEVLLHARQRHLAYVDEIKGRPIEARKGINLLGKTAGIVGLGSIGARAAELLGGLGMEVIAWNRSERPGFRCVTALEELFQQSHVICLCLKTVREGAEANVGVVSVALLQHCSGAIVVNLANRDLVDNTAMGDALRSGAVAAYTVERADDVLEAFKDLEQVHMPPSNSWLSDDSLQMLRHVWVRMCWMRSMVSIRTQYRSEGTTDMTTDLSVVAARRTEPAAQGRERGR